MRLLVGLPKDSRRDCFRRGRWRDFALKLIPPPGSRFTSSFAKVYVFTETAIGYIPFAESELVAESVKILLVL